MWNPELLYDISTAISDEARGRWNALDQGRLQKEQFTDLLTFWSPTVNMARDPRWGRTPETYGEDPFLTAETGTAFVRGLQGNDPRYLKVVSTPKHFAANNEEHNRFECNAVISEKQLREYYLPGFEACVRRGHAASIMTAYNAINGVPCTANPWLPRKVLREDWGFDGYVVSDCGAPGFLRSAHHWVKEKMTAATLALQSGLDLECGDNVYMEPLREAYRLGMVSDADIDRAARNILTARMRLGMFDSPEHNPYTKIPESVIGSPKHCNLALESARQAIVLLKNEDGTLPLRKGRDRRIGVVGINAGRCELGDYSGNPSAPPVSILQGIKDLAKGGFKVDYAPWISPRDGMETIPAQAYHGPVKAEFFRGESLEGTPAVEQVEWINFEPSNLPPDPNVPAPPHSARWTAKLRPDVTGDYVLRLTAQPGGRLKFNGRTVIDKWNGMAQPADTFAVRLEAGKDYDVVVEYHVERDYSIARLDWRKPRPAAADRLAAYGRAGEVARKSDVVIAVMGINKSIEREGHDRTELTLPAEQREFLEELYKVNKRIVLVLVAGSQLALNWEHDHLPAIVNAWYPGQQGGTAVAEVLFGMYNPAGRVPLTYYRSQDDLPAFDDYDITKRTYMYYQGPVLYPFGYGLSYTTFEYSGLRVEDKGETLDVSFHLKNSGTMDGDEVCQVYTRLREYEGKAPIKQLKGFKRVHLRRG